MQLYKNFDNRDSLTFWHLHFGFQPILNVFGFHDFYDPYKILIIISAYKET